MELARLDTRVTWLLAGVPILVTFFQTVTTLLNTPAGTSPLQGIVEPIHDITVFRQGAIVFWQSNELILGIFAIITIAWLVQGAGMFVLRHRDLTFAAAGLVSVLFFALFWGVYAPLLGEIPPGQAIVFFSTPVFASAFSGISAWKHDWAVDIQERSSEVLASAERDLQAARDAFDDAFDSRIDDPGRYEHVAPTGADRARDQREAFHRDCDDLQSTIDDLRASNQDAESFQRRATDCRERVEALDPTARADQTVSVLEDAVKSGIRTTYGTISEYADSGDRFTLVNLPSRLRNVDIPVLEATVHIDTVDETLVNAIDSGTPLPTVATAIDQVEAHLDEIRSTLDDHESSFRSRRTDVEGSLEQVERILERIDGQAGTRLGEFVVDGRHDAVTTIPAIREELETAEERLVTCQFEEAVHRLDESRTRTDELLSLVEFVQAVEGSVSSGAIHISLPQRVNPDVITDLVPAFETTYDITASVADGAIHIEHHDVVESESTDPMKNTERDGTGGQQRPAGMSNGDGRSGRSSGTGGHASSNDGSQDRSGRSGGASSSDDGGVPARPEDRLDAVLYIFRELNSAAGTTAGEAVELQVGRLPETVVESDVFDIVHRFVTRQTDLVADVSVPEGGPPGYIEIIPLDGKTGRGVTERLHERYEERYAGSE